jgi:hypothetical protein
MFFHHFFQLISSYNASFVWINQFELLVKIFIISRVDRLNEDVEESDA